MCKVSAVIIGYNSEKYINKCIESVINQTLQDIEIVCIDDGSNDNTFMIMKDYALEDKRIKVYSQKNSGPYIARMYGLNNATGEYVVFIDSDDWIENNMLEEVYDCISKNNLNLVFFDMVKDDMINNISNHIKLPISSEKIILKKEISDVIYKKCMNNTQFSSPCNKMIKRSYINSLDIQQDVKLLYGEDLIFMLELYDKLECTYYIPKEYYHYCSYSKESLSKRHNNDAFFEVHKYLYNIRRVYAKKWSTEKYLYASMLFLGVCEIIYDIKDKKNIFVIKRYIRDDIFRECVLKTDKMVYREIVGKMSTWNVVRILKILLKILGV